MNINFLLFINYRLRLTMIHLIYFTTGDSVHYNYINFPICLQCFYIFGAYIKLYNMCLLSMKIIVK